MNLQETHRFWEECQAKRFSALAAGVPEDDAHAVARDHWNQWAEERLAERKRLQDAGAWQVDEFGRGQNRATQDWFDTSNVVFSSSVEPISFVGDVSFEGWTFPAYARFGNAKFQGYARFDNARFQGYAGFATVTFGGVVSYTDAEFQQAASFQAIKATRAFSLAGATFHRVPDFIQAEFSEAPRLDNSRIRPAFVQPRRLWLAPDLVYRQAWRWRKFIRRLLGPQRSGLQRAALRVAIEPELFWQATKRAAGNMWERLTNADRDAPAQWRALRRLSVAAHDHDREHRFLAGEIRSLRFAGDWPLPLRRFNVQWSNKPRERWQKQYFGWLGWLPLNFWDGAMWRGWARFWFGYGYQALSGFGRSIVRPVLLWCALVAVFTCVYLSGMREMPDRVAQRYTSNDHISETWRSLDMTVFAWQTGLPCSKGDGGNIIGLKPEITEGTNAFWEALRISIANGAVVGDLGGTEAARLAYGCLYGLERIVPAKVNAAAESQGRPASSLTVTYLPPGIITATRWQKLFSALLIFLFGLAVRNMLRMR